MVRNMLLGNKAGGRFAGRPPACCVSLRFLVLWRA